MSALEPSIQVQVDVTNPGQFFACCGLLELADRLWPGAEGWFADDTFAVIGDNCQSVDVLVNELTHTALQPASDCADKTLRPILLEAFGLTLDWWVDGAGKKTSLKLWAGQQTSLKIVEQLRSALAQLNGRLTDKILDARQPMTGRFGVDPRAAWQALDVGFSPNEQSMEVATYPAVELLAGVGLQVFRPVPDEGGFCYRTWSAPLPNCVARAACAGLVPGGVIQRFRFGIAVRGSYKGFDFATLIGEQ